MVAGLIVLWPSGEGPPIAAPQNLPTETEQAEVERVEEFACPRFQPGICRTVHVRIGTGAYEGLLTSFELTAPEPLDPEIDVGDGLRVVQLSPDPDPTFDIADFERRSPMLWLAILFAVVVVVFGRLRGALSLIGLVISLLVVLVFIVPAIRDGESPLAVAIVGSLAVMLVTIGLGHGVNLKSLAAMLGTTASLLLVALLALVFTHAAHLTGLSSEGAASVGFQSGISIQGLLLAGMVIGALGVLDDITVSQASTVVALRSANPELRFRSLYGRSLSVGRDHASAAVNTLVLAYVGASLPILLIFSSEALGVVEVVNLELVANEVVAMLVGSIGLIAAVPLTTALTAWLSAHLDRDALIASKEAGHSH